VTSGALLTCACYLGSSGFGTSVRPQEAGAIAALTSTEKEYREETHAAQQAAKSASELPGDPIIDPTPRAMNE
jgi:hypothetical protein